MPIMLLGVFIYDDNDNDDDNYENNNNNNRYWQQPRFVHYAWVWVPKHYHRYIIHERSEGYIYMRFRLHVTPDAMVHCTVYICTCTCKGYFD